jgi:hypothetical protein
MKRPWLPPLCDHSGGWKSLDERGFGHLFRWRGNGASGSAWGVDAVRKFGGARNKKRRTVAGSPF